MTTYASVEGQLVCQDCLRASDVDPELHHGDHSYVCSRCGEGYGEEFLRLVEQAREDAHAEGYDEAQGEAEDAEERLKSDASEIAERLRRACDGVQARAERERKGKKGSDYYEAMKIAVIAWLEAGAERDWQEGKS